jgi:hypothetical protein
MMNEIMTPAQQWMQQKRQQLNLVRVWWTQQLLAKPWCTLM